MSATTRQTPAMTVPGVRARKGGEPLVCLTAYTTPMARFLDAAADLLLVGDSVGMVLYGMDSTLGVDLDTMIRHGAAAVRGADSALVVVDMPFGSYQESPAAAFRSTARVLGETGCQAVKLEGGSEMAETVAFLTARGVPVLGHVGLTPQGVHATGGFRVQGRTPAEAERIVDDARAVAAAGAFALVIEGVVEEVAREITEAVDVPTIGIGAASDCDGQILVAEDMLGLFTDFVPRHVHRYAELGADIREAAGRYAADVRARRFPGPGNVFGGGGGRS